jgi:nitrilase
MFDGTLFSDMSALVAKVAAVQSAPVYLNAAATIAKMRLLVREAVTHGAKLVAFPEVFVAGYPYWAWFDAPLEQKREFKEFYKAAITIPGPEFQQLLDISAEFQVSLVTGLNEREPSISRSLFNTNVVVSHGKFLGKHRKLVPTYAEKLVWGNGDGSGYQVYETPCGRLGTLPCGENTNTLARFALLAQGEQIHVANFPAFPFSDWYDEAEAIRIRCQAHAFEGKIYVISSTSLIDDSFSQRFSFGPADKCHMTRKNFALTAIFGPDGRFVGDPLIDIEGIVYAELDLERQVCASMMHDITGHYNQFGVLALQLNRAPHLPLIEAGFPEHFRQRPLREDNARSGEPCRAEVQGRRNAPVRKGRSET